MRKSIRIIFFFIMFNILGMGLLNAQSVSGKVIASDDKLPLSNVTVSVKGLRNSTVTKDDGTYKINAGSNEVIVFSFVGYKRQEVKVGNLTNINITLAPSNVDLGAVVVTALDIKKNPKELGYSTQKVSGAEIAETQRDNFINALQGRIAGVTVTPTSGTAGASSSIVLRGFNSLSGNNQPLFVVDGVILNNSTFDEQNGYGLASDRPNRSNDYTNRIADLNSNDFESVVVLKGPEAAALYGSQASAGAIIITLKKPKLGQDKFVKLNYDNSFRNQYINRFPDIQKVFSTGINGASSNTTNSFGPTFAPQTKIYDNVNNFFRPGKSQQNNWTVDFGNKKVAMKYSGSVLDQRGTVYSNDFVKYSGRLSLNTKLFKNKLEINPSFFTTTQRNNRPLRGAAGYMQSLLNWNLKDDVRKYEESGPTQFLDDGETLVLIDNPYFANLYNRNYDQNTRTSYQLATNFNPYKWLAISGRFGVETSAQRGLVQFHPNAATRSESANGGYIDAFWNNINAGNHLLTATVKKSFGKWNTRLMVGQSWQRSNRGVYAVSGAQIRDVNAYDTSQILGPKLRLQRNNDLGLEQLIKFRQAAYFGEFAVNYDEIVFLSITGRTESSSTLPTKTRNYSYPGASMSFVFSDLGGLKNSNFLTYGKLRVSAANTARINSPYSNQSRIQTPSPSGFPGAGQGFTGNNPNLVPEKQATYETGLELKLLKNRIGLDFTYYNTRVKDIILEDFRASYPAVGSVLGTTNGGVLLNQGFEVTLDINPIKNKNINWGIKFNFSKTWNKVLSLPGAVPEFYISDTWLAGDVRNGIFPGGTTTSISGLTYRRNTNGDLLINPATGLPLRNTDEWKLIGERNPDFVLATINTLKVKNFGLSFLWDLKIGGDIYNATDWFLTNNGKSKRTLDRLTPRVVKGVLNDGYQNSSTPTQNNIVVTPYTNQAYWGSLLGEEFIEKDVNWLRLRDVTLTYNLGSKTVSKLKFFKNLSIFATVTDPVLFTNYSGADPSVNGNTPASKGVGGFGFDYLNVGMPVSYNLGLRTSF